MCYMRNLTQTKAVIISNDRITGNYLSNLSVDFMWKSGKCKVTILEYIQWFSNIVNNTEEKFLLKILLIYVVIL